MAADTGIVSNFTQPSRRTKIGRIKDLLRGRHGPNDPIFHALARYSPDYEYYFEDFTAAAITATTGPFAAGAPHTWTYAETAGTPDDPAKLAPTTTKTSCLTLATTAVAGYGHLMYGPKMYNADKNPFFEVRFALSQVTDVEVTIGFADAVPASAAVIVSDIDTPAITTVADGALYHIDIAETLKTAALVVIGTTTAVSKVNVAPTAAPFGVPTAVVFTTVRVQLEGDGSISGPSTAKLFVNDSLVAEAKAVGPDSEKMLFPVIRSSSPGGTASIMDIDYVMCGQHKAGSPF